MRELAYASLAVKRRLQSLETGLDASLETDPEGLHKARVATRRLREALPLVIAPHTPGPHADFRHDVHCATRALGGVREMDVALALVNDLAAERPDLRAALDQIRTAMAVEREARVARMRRRVDAVALQRESGRLAEQLDDLVRSTWPIAQLADRLQVRLTEIRAAVTEAGLLYAPERLHRIRIAAKKLRYALELASDIRLASTKRLVTEMKRMQDRLGLLHDLETVAGVARQTMARTDVPEAAERTVSLLEARIRKQHADYLAHRDHFLVVIARAVAVRERVRRSRPSRPRPVTRAGRQAGPRRRDSRPGRVRS